ncbi:PAS domain S-box protein [Candidatus Acetothermia bacterium]|nr:PAS domain S-box protein [Candidatus Acetothermia bacterium]
MKELFKDQSQFEHVFTELQRLREFNASIIETMAEGLAVEDLEGRFIFVNRRLQTMLGYTAEELIGQIWTKIIPLDQQPKVAEHTQQRIKGKANHYETALLTKDGRRIAVLISATPFTQDGQIAGTMATLIDITESKQLEKTLIQNERRFRALIEHSYDAIALIAADGTIQYVSPATFRILGYTSDELVGRSAFEFFHPEDLLYVTNLFSQLVQTPRTSVVAQCRYRHKDGSWQWIEGTGVNLLDEPSIGAIVANYRDINERRRAEEVLKETNERLARAVAELQAAQSKIIEQERLRALGQMAAGIAHDFNNALSPILGFSELLLMQAEPRTNQEKWMHYVQTINTAAQDAAKVVSRLREFYRSRAQEEPVEPLDLNPLVEQAIEMTQPRWKDQTQAYGISIQVVTDLHSTPLIVGNKTELREVLTNLIFNAVDAIAQKVDEGDQQPRSGTITIRTRRAGEHVTLEVSDTGIGMTEEVRQRCLEPFFSTKGERGTGLGLAMVHGIIRRHNGTLDIVSEAGQGATFIIDWPVHAGQKWLTPKAKEKETGVRPLRVLIVDDEPLVCEMLTEYLTGDGHRVEVATNGREGLGKFLASRFDLIVTDRGMPEMNGEQLASAIKQIAPNKPIILLTGFGDLMKTSGERPPAVDLIVNKPVTLTALRQAIAKITAE